MDADCLCLAAPGFASYRTRIVRELEQPLRSALARKAITPEDLVRIEAALPDIILGIQEKIHEWLGKRSKGTPRSDVEERIREATKVECDQTHNAHPAADSQVQPLSLQRTVTVTPNQEQPSAGGQAQQVEGDPKPTEAGGCWCGPRPKCLVM
jgi:hypothetical protein